MKKFSISKKIHVALSFLGVIFIIMCLMNVSALKNISELNSQACTNINDYKIAYESGDLNQIVSVEKQIASTMQHAKTRIDGTYVFDVVLVFIAIALIGFIGVLLNRMISRPIKSTQYQEAYDLAQKYFSKKW